MHSSFSPAATLSCQTGFSLKSVSSRCRALIRHPLSERESRFHRTSLLHICSGHALHCTHVHTPRRNPYTLHPIAALSFGFGCMDVHKISTGFVSPKIATLARTHCQSQHQAAFWRKLVGTNHGKLTYHEFSGVGRLHDRFGIFSMEVKGPILGSGEDGRTGRLDARTTLVWPRRS